ncbi:methylenetetrahydrofolate reductase [Cryptosporangium sp. NPDC048952]|uniref:methylenetetrahydrofolate reductase n=1 Tax=Cryptosporangium sp. NPDC048952 TaxID=3363961 RepID=UPI00371F06E5
MTASPIESAAAVVSLLDDYSLEMTGKDVPKLDEARATIPAGTRVNVTFLGNEDLQMRLSAARAVARWGFVPVPHISARRLASQAQLEEFLGALAESGVNENVFTVAGDPAKPEGPYEDALAVIRSGLLEQHGVRHVSISGYPEGHPDIPGPSLWTSLEDKAAALREQSLPGTIITQFGFDSDAVLTWVEAVRDRGIDLPIRIGVPGPAGVRRLMTYAARFGVGTSTSIAKKYGLSITNLMSTAGPDKFLHALAGGYDPARHGVLKLHFYTFGGMKATSEWVVDFKKGA